MSNFKDVENFMKTFGQEVKDRPKFPSDKIVQFEAMKKFLPILILFKPLITLF